LILYLLLVVGRSQLLLRYYSAGPSITAFWSASFRRPQNPKPPALQAGPLLVRHVKGHSIPTRPEQQQQSQYSE
jgi:hypothetical protein